MTEARYMIARGLSYLSEGGMLLCAADNKAGGARLVKLIKEFGLSDVIVDTRNKARCVSGVKNALDSELLKRMIDFGGEQLILEGQYTSQPGIFGWDKIDKGSELLMENLPDTIEGNGVDFGCGYGYLSHSILNRYDGIESLTCIDADHRAIEVCKKNLSGFSNVHMIWKDLLIPCKDLKNIDFVIMNPPFHEAKTMDTDIGVSFIKSASVTLRNKGRLYMVANRKLPYEPTLAQYFSTVQKCDERNGFKVFVAIK